MSAGMLAGAMLAAIAASAKSVAFPAAVAPMMEARALGGTPLAKAAAATWSGIYDANLRTHQRPPKTIFRRNSLVGKNGARDGTTQSSTDTTNAQIDGRGNTNKIGRGGQLNNDDELNDGHGTANSDQDGVGNC